jgi:hypothetical protein
MIRLIFFIWTILTTAMSSEYKFKSVVVESSKHYSEIAYNSVKNALVKEEYLVAKAYEHDEKSDVYNVIYISNLGKVIHAEYITTELLDPWVPNLSTEVVGPPQNLCEYEIKAIQGHEFKGDKPNTVLRELNTLLSNIKPNKPIAHNLKFDSFDKYYLHNRFDRKKIVYNAITLELNEGECLIKNVSEVDTAMWYSTSYLTNLGRIITSAYNKQATYRSPTTIVEIKMRTDKFSEDEIELIINTDFKFGNIKIELEDFIGMMQAYASYQSD